MTLRADDADTLLAARLSQFAYEISADTMERSTSIVDSSRDHDDHSTGVAIPPLLIPIGGFEAMRQHQVPGDGQSEKSRRKRRPTGMRSPSDMSDRLPTDLIRHLAVSGGLESGHRNIGFDRGKAVVQKAVLCPDI